MKPINYYASLEARINGAINKTADARALEALIAEAEFSLAEAPNPVRLRATLDKLQAAQAYSLSHRAQVVR